MDSGLPKYQPTRRNDISNLFRLVTKSKRYFQICIFLFKLAQARTTLVFIIGCLIDGQIVLFKHL